MDAPESQNGFDRLFSEGRVLSLLGLLIFISYPGVVLCTQAFFYRDTGLFSYPVAYYLRDSLREGQIPLWNPCSNCGVPFLAQWNTMALYPFSLFYVLLPMPWSLNFFLLGHILLGGSGMYRLAHYWFGSRLAASVAALVFAWNGVSLQFIMWPCHNAALAWMPWVVLHCQRAGKEGGRRVYWAALAAACQMLTGSPEIILLTWLIVAVCFVRDVAQKEQFFWTAGRRLICLGALAGALSAAQLLPTLAFLAHGDRTSAYDGRAWSLPPWGVANFLLPLFHTSGSVSGVFYQNRQQWIASYYVGIVPLLLGAIAVWRARTGRTRLLGLLALAGVFLALGQDGFLLGVLKRALPLLGFIRYPVKFIVLTVFCLALLAGAGAAWMQGRPPDVARRSLPGPAAWLSAGVLFFLAVEFWLPFPLDSWSAVLPNAVGRLVVLAAGAVLLALIFKTKPLPGRWVLGFGFLLLTGLDVCTHEPSQNPVIPVPGLRRLSAAHDAAAARGRVARLAQPRRETEDGEHVLCRSALAVFGPAGRIVLRLQFVERHSNGWRVLLPAPGRGAKGGRSAGGWKSAAAPGRVPGRFANCPAAAAVRVGGANELHAVGHHRPETGFPG